MESAISGPVCEGSADVESAGSGIGFTQVRACVAEQRVSLAMEVTGDDGGDAAC